MTDISYFLTNLKSVNLLSYAVDESSYLTILVKYSDLYLIYSEFSSFKLHETCKSFVEIMLEVIAG